MKDITPTTKKVGRPAAAVKQRTKIWDVDRVKDSENVQAVRARFLEAYDFLRDNGTIKSDYAFTKQNGILASRVFNLRTKETSLTPIDFILALVDSYNVSPSWILKGEGEMFNN